MGFLMLCMSNNNTIKESLLNLLRLRYIMHAFRPTTTATALLIGTLVGAGFLGIPYVTARAGFLSGFIHIIVLGVSVCILTLYLAEIALRTKQNHQLAGYAKKYLGNSGKIFMLISTIGGIYAALMAYLIGQGQSISHIVTGTTQHTVVALLAVWIIFAYITHRRASIGKSEVFGVSLMFILMLIIIVLKAQSIQIENLATFSASKALLPFGVILFSFLGFSAIPEMKILLSKHPAKMKSAIIFSYLCAGVLYAVFTIVVVGTYGLQTPEIATLALEKILIALSIITLSTAYLALTLALIDTLVLDCSLTRKKAWLLSNLVPLALVLLLASFNKAKFTFIIGIGGILSGTLTALLILAMLPRARRSGDFKSKDKIQAPYSKWIAWLLALLFIGGALAELL